MRKSIARTPNYRPGTSRKVASLSTFREQMSDFARSERLVALRKARHLSREKLANEVGVSTKAVYAWENGGGIRWPNAQALGKFYGVDPETLVTRDASDTVVPLPPAEETQLDRIESALAELTAKLDALQADQDDLRTTLARDALGRAAKRVDGADPAPAADRPSEGRPAKGPKANRPTG